MSDIDYYVSMVAAAQWAHLRIVVEICSLFNIAMALSKIDISYAF